MSSREITRWTAAMVRTGERIDLSELPRPTADKHSTGGVGDKVTLPLAPLLAACGVAVPQVAGRGLGHTGGTLDKLESIAGRQASLSNARVRSQLESVGAVICAASDVVLDVKVGSGGFIKTTASARDLASTMVTLGDTAGVRTTAVLSDMDTPLGFTAGNAIEVEESVEVLAGSGPSDVVEL